MTWRAIHTRPCNGVVEPARGMHGFVGPPRVWKRFPRTGGLAVSRAFGDTNLSTAGRCSHSPTCHVNLSRVAH